jgi:hypothetical protein
MWIAFGLGFFAGILATTVWAALAVASEDWRARGATRFCARCGGACEFDRYSHYDEGSGT